MLKGFLVLIGCQLLGEFLVVASDIPIPGAVLGMILLLLGLVLKGSVPEGLDVAGEGLLKYIGLLFVPAGAGISLYLDLLSTQWDIILIASVGSTILTLITSGALFQFLNKKDTEHAD